MQFATVPVEVTDPRDEVRPLHPGYPIHRDDMRHAKPTDDGMKAWYRRGGLRCGQERGDEAGVEIGQVGILHIDDVI